MITTTYFALGFVFFIIFNMITFDTYAKKKESTNEFILMFIFIYYCLLAIYLINLVDIEGTFIEILVQCMIFVIVGSIVMYNHYESVIKKKDDSLGFEKVNHRI